MSLASSKLMTRLAVLLLTPPSRVLTPAEFEALSNKEIDLARVIANSAEAASAWSVQVSADLVALTQQLDHKHQTT
jgi:hypothetical protein